MGHRRSTLVLALFAVPLAFGAKPDPFLAPLAKAQAAFDAGRHAEALRQGSALSAKYPGRWEGHRLVARAALALNQPDRAEAAFRQSLRTAPASLRPSLQSGLKEAGRLRDALRQMSYALSLKASGDLAAAARAEESAYRTFPTRPAFGLAAADLFESAGLLADAQRLLTEVRDANPRLGLDARLASLKARVEAMERETAVQKEAEDRRFAEARRAEDERKATEAARRAKAAEEKRAEDERRAEEERQEEKLRADREETERLKGVLADQRRQVADAEGAVRSAEDRIGDAERTVRRLDDEADRARGRRDAAKRERDDIADKLNDAKGDLAKQVYREQLRTAEAKHNDAKDDYDRADRRLDDAKSKRDGARSDAGAARRTLEGARQSVRETEAALQRIASGG